MATDPQVLVVVEHALWTRIRRVWKAPPTAATLAQLSKCRSTTKSRSPPTLTSNGARREVQMLDATVLSKLLGEVDRELRTARGRPA
jgi:hypothetical protein